MPNAVELVKHDHRKVEALFDKYQKGDASVVEQICTELKIHTKIEEQVLYPALPEISDGQQLRQEAEHEHQEVEDAIKRLEASGSDTAVVEECMQLIMNGVKHHVQEEETEILPKMEQQLGDSRLTALGDQLLAAKREQLVNTGAIVDLTKEELYQLAQGAGVEGRSDMTKEQLLEALRG